MTKDELLKRIADLESDRDEILKTNTELNNTIGYLSMKVDHYNVLLESRSSPLKQCLSENVDLHRQIAEGKKELEVLEHKISQQIRFRCDVLRELDSVKVMRDLALKEHSAAMSELQYSRRYAQQLKEAVLSVLCDPEGRPCFAGSDGDRKVIDDALNFNQNKGD